MTAQQRFRMIPKSGTGLLSQGKSGFPVFLQIHLSDALLENG